MQVTYEDLEILTEIQRIDLEIIQAKKTRATLPQRIQVIRIRKKREEISPKLDQVLELSKSVESKQTKIEDEDRELAQKQERAQEIITAAGSDFRKVESHSKDMAGVAKRREYLAEELAKLMEEHDRIAAVAKQLQDAIAQCDKEETDLRASYQEEDQALVDKARKLTAQRNDMAEQLPTHLVDDYDKVAKKAGGVALGRLADDGACSVCRSSITGGRLIEIQSKAPLGTCPHCGRMLIIGE